MVNKLALILLLSTFKIGTLMIFNSGVGSSYFYKRVSDTPNISAFGLRQTGGTSPISRPTSRSSISICYLGSHTISGCWRKAMH